MTERDPLRDILRSGDPASDGRAPSPDEIASMRRATLNEGPDRLTPRWVPIAVAASALALALFITSTGQSGHPLSRHYDDLAGLWRRGEYIGMSLDPDLARAAAAGITTLTPAD